MEEGEVCPLCMGVFLLLLFLFCCGAREVFLVLALALLVVPGRLFAAMKYVLRFLLCLELFCFFCFFYVAMHIFFRV